MVLFLFVCTVAVVLMRHQRRQSTLVANTYHNKQLVVSETAILHISNMWTDISMFTLCC